MEKVVGIVVLGLLSAFCPIVSTAQDTAPPPAEGNYHGVPYLGGGIGEEEREQVLSRAKDFNLKLVFAGKDGGYLADIDVVVQDAKGLTLLEVKSTGPILLTNLPTGRYQVTAASEGQEQRRDFAMSAKGSLELILRW